MALNMATPNEIELAAKGVGKQGVPVDKYKSQMATSGWGDNLMIAVLARDLKRSITVISESSSRTFTAYGEELDGADEYAIWVAYLQDFHYFA